jgi:chemotaxis protein MotB
MAKKRGGGGGGHGGGWFVTFADLMALLMSFFVMLTAYSTTNKEKLNAVSGSMREAFGTQKTLRGGVVEIDGIPTKPYLKNVFVKPIDEASDVTAPNTLKRKDEGTVLSSFDRGFALASSSLRQAMQDLPEVLEASKSVMIEQTRDGLNINLVDQDGRSMFADGAIQPVERTRRILERIAPTLRRMPNRIAISGHTSAAKPGSRPGWSAWELSAGRAAAVREILANAGVPEDRFASITGRSDTEPLFPDNPYLAANRRVTITLLFEAPPAPTGLKP